MGMWTAVRGWIELDDEQRREVERTIVEWMDGRFAGGWAFPEASAWSQFALYGMNVKDLDVPDLFALVKALAQVTPTAYDNDMTMGFFVLTDEYAKVTAWEIAYGEVRVRDAPELAWTAQP